MCQEETFPHQDGDNCANTCECACRHFSRWILRGRGRFDVKDWADRVVFVQEDGEYFLSEEVQDQVDEDLIEKGHYFDMARYISKSEAEKGLALLSSCHCCNRHMTDRLKIDG